MLRLTTIVILVLMALSVTASAESQSQPSKPEFLTSGQTTKLNLPFSEAVRVGNILYLSGMIAVTPGTMQLVAGGIEAETRQTMLNIREVLERYGSSMDQVFNCTVMLADIAEWPKMNAAYVEFFSTRLPARSAMGVSGLALGARVEITCMATINPA